MCLSVGELLLVDYSWWKDGSYGISWTSIDSRKQKGKERREWKGCQWKDGIASRLTITLCNLQAKQYLFYVAHNHNT